LERTDEQVVAAWRGDREDEFQRAFAREPGRRHRVGAVGARLCLGFLVAADGHRDPGVGHGLVRGEAVQEDAEAIAAQHPDELVGIRLGGDPWIAGGDRRRRGTMVMPIVGKRRGRTGGQKAQANKNGLDAAQGAVGTDKHWENPGS
jgi:hypothetical protein